MTTTKITSKSEILIDRIQMAFGGTKSKIIELALKELDKSIAFNNFNQAYAQLKLNEDLWEEELKERKLLEGTSPPKP